MLMSLLSRLLSAYFCFALPSYATFKALSGQPRSEPDLQRWSMYWAVIGAFTSLEYVLEWAIDWFPLYWELKTLFLLFLALPQTQGSTFIYQSYLRPFFAQNEATFDAEISAIPAKIVYLLQTGFTKILQITGQLSNKSGTGVAQSSSSQGPDGALFGTALNAIRAYSSAVLGSKPPSSGTNVPTAPSPVQTPNRDMPVPFQPIGSPAPEHL